ncbi:MAG: hypothetical protein FK731_07200 [Asgard group archaeon]|nr:hypothetical protein [Asgard group archaeon]
MKKSKKILLIIVLMGVSLLIPQQKAELLVSHNSPANDLVLLPNVEGIIFEFDQPIPAIVGRSFSIMFTCFSDSQPINVTAGFLINQTLVVLYQESRDYFVNHEVYLIIPVSFNESNYNLFFWVEDNAGQVITDSYELIVDPILPEITMYSFSTFELLYKEYLEISYVVEDENFHSVEVFVGDSWATTSSSKSGIIVVTWDKFDLPQGLGEMDFKVTLCAIDVANNRNEVFETVHYIDTRFGYYDPEAQATSTRNAIILSSIGLLVLLSLPALIVGGWVKGDPSQAPKNPSPKKTSFIEEKKTSRGRRIIGSATNKRSFFRKMIDRGGKEGLDFLLIKKN